MIVFHFTLLFFGLLMLNFVWQVTRSGPRTMSSVITFRTILSASGWLMISIAIYLLARSFD